MTDEQLNQKIAETFAGIAELRKSIAEDREAHRKTQEELSKLSKEIRNYIGNDAQSVEEYFYQTLKQTMELGGIQYDHIARNLQLHDNAPEFDTVLFNGGTICLIEVKKKAHPEQLLKMAKNKVQDFKQCFPNYADFAFHVGIATMVSHQELIRQAKEAGVYLLTQKSEQLACLNEDVITF